MLQAQTITGHGKYVIIPKAGDSIVTPEILPEGSTIIGNHNLVLGVPIQEAENDGDMLAKIDGKNLPFPVLPAIGQQVIIDNIYQYEGKAVICRQTHTRMNFTPYETPALFSFYRDETADMLWIPNEQVALNSERTYNSVKYKCIQAHMTLAGWEPPNVPSLWQIIQSGCPEWVQPTGAQDAYNIDACVTFQGQEYISLINANVWAPTVYPAGWQLK